MTRAQLSAGHFTIPCVIGRSGAGWRKREGDGRTPKGKFCILSGFFRADSVHRFRTSIPFESLRMRDGWCDAPHNPNYNRPVRLPFAASHERLWRDDRLYDIALVLDYNFRRRCRGRGSAIFFHVWRDGHTPTEGCVAIDPQWMRRLLPLLAADAVIEIL